MLRESACMSVIISHSRMGLSLMSATRSNCRCFGRWSQAFDSTTSTFSNFFVGCSSR